MSAAGKQSNNSGQDDEGEEEDDEVGDLVSAINYNTINYNTISSMAVLKEILGAQDSPEDADWFQHYFLRHVNRLPSRSHQFVGRRLSECKEEDEHLEHNPKSPVADDQSNSTTVSAKSTPPISPPSHHRDKHFFDVNLVEMKSQASSSSTLDYDSMDEVWVKRYDAETVKRRTELGSQPLPTSADESDGQCVSINRPRSGTWSKGGSAPVLLPAVVAALTKTKKGSLGVERRQSGDDILAKGTPKVQLQKNKLQQPQLPQQQAQHVSQCTQKKMSPKPRTSQSPSHTRKTYALLDAFRPRSKSDAASKKNNTIMLQMKNSIQQTLKSPGSSARNSISGSSSSTDTEPTNSVPPATRNRYKQTTVPARPRAGSDSTSTKGAVSKMMDLFRHRSQSAVSAEDKRKARAANIPHTNFAQGALLRRSSLDPETRRLSLGTISNSRKGSDGLLDPTHAAILFRDSRGLPVADPFLEKVKITDLAEDESQIFVKFFRFHKSYDLIPTSAKLVVFDTQLIVKKAFFALVYNGVRAAPLWDNKRQQFVGMLTITDFIRILQKYYSTPSSSMEELEEHKLDTWRNELHEERPQELISIGPDMSLFLAIQTLINNKIHRLPVIDPLTGDVLYIITHKRILRFLFLYINDLPKPSYMSKSLEELKIGTYENIETVSEDTSIILALKKFVERRVSALPMVDKEGRLVDIFAKFDVINLAAERTYNNLDVSLKQANEHRSDWFEGVQKCHLTDTLYCVIEKIVRAEVHRLVIVDSNDKVIGILSLSDILHYLVLRPSGVERLLKTKELYENNADSPKALNSIMEPESALVM